MSITASPRQRQHISFRIPVRDLEEIDRQANTRGLTRSAYILQACLGELDIEPAHERFNQLELRISRLEHRIGL